MLRKILVNFSENLARLITQKDYDLPHQLKANATREAVEFYHKFMNCQVFNDKKSMIDFELEQVKVDGLYLEFGVAKATHTNYIASKIDPKIIHVFDSFRGFPESWNGTSKDYHNYNGVMPKVSHNVILHNGWFEDTIPKFVKENNEKIAYLNIDCDLYSSTKTIFNNLGDKIQNGTIIHFDEYLNFPDWKNHEFKAFMEFVKEKNISFEYIGVGNGMVAVKLISLTNSRIN
uniref:ORF14 n=1 Tax=Nitrosopumilaceae spindle-shaped virus TaxID=3065433 RepID=A0AAT9J7L3_9VIRU